MVVARSAQATNVVPLVAQPALLLTQAFSAAQRRRSFRATVLVPLQLLAHQDLAHRQDLARHRGPLRPRHLRTALLEQLCCALLPPGAFVQVRSVAETGVPALLHQIAFAAVNILRL